MHPVAAGHSFPGSGRAASLTLQRAKFGHLCFNANGLTASNMKTREGPLLLGK